MRDRECLLGVMGDWVVLSVVTCFVMVLPGEMETDAEYEQEGGPKSQGRKRKWEDMELHEEHDGFDPMQLKEHEEFTKASKSGCVCVWRAATGMAWLAACIKC